MLINLIVVIIPLFKDQHNSTLFHVPNTLLLLAQFESGDFIQYAVGSKALVHMNLYRPSKYGPDVI